MKFKYHKYQVSNPSHVERVWKLCYNKRKIAALTVETSPHGYSPSLLLQLGGDALFYKSLSIYKLLISFTLLPYV